MVPPPSLLRLCYLRYLGYESIFDGGLTDIKTLGGAGFASQSHTSPYDLSKFNGLSITIQPSARRDCSIFHLNIKTELPKKRKDGRNESVIVWEYEFDVSDTMMMNMGTCSVEKSSLKEDRSSSSRKDNEKEVMDEKEMEEGTINTAARTKTFKANWDDFIPTYRGRPVPRDETKPFNPGEIKEISIMCRSNVGSFVLTVSVLNLHKWTSYIQLPLSLTSDLLIDPLVFLLSVVHSLVNNLAILIYSYRTLQHLHQKRQKKTKDPLFQC